MIPGNSHLTEWQETGAARKGGLQGSLPANHMVQGFESSVDTFIYCGHMHPPSGKLDSTVGCVYLLTQMYYSWVFILKIFQENKIS